MSNAGGVVTLVLIYLLVFGGLGIGALVSYILRGVGMYTLGKRRGMDYPWLAFIPYARTWFQGELCGTLHFGHKELKSPGIWLLVIPVVGGIVTGLFSIFIWGGLALQITEMVTSVTATTYSDAYYSYQGGASVGGFLMMLVGILLFALVSLAVSAVSGTLEVLVNRQIFARYAPDNNALLHAVMGIFLPLYTSIYFFLIRNRERGPQPGPGGISAPGRPGISNGSNRRIKGPALPYKYMGGLFYVAESKKTGLLSSDHPSLALRGHRIFKWARPGVFFPGGQCRGPGEYRGG